MTEATSITFSAPDLNHKEMERSGAEIRKAKVIEGVITTSELAGVIQWYSESFTWGKDCMQHQPAHQEPE